ncbi:double-strand break repair enhancer MSC1 [Aspergillus clavatus NRRL 1]|uniref:Stress response protein (Ish1), putative n=1 Tax=Aspergillus clavatus (strain ATCC 1007 / CBS 513.65 / DSM 816 / NCTC 3887 / NRRL 1 / QM 1276 / 107) TaxID=344612 RepID=A1CKF3_ASPCL|nr:stress response protein (Ish1), putative [Aspergillus clavatus NRRL 1]EAW09627.1 stress response protein (Ish1), putative [Aspergillus clavatus NRRL 1]
MRLNLGSSLVLFLASTQAVGAFNWLHKAVYNRWHETELERWLSDHDIPYPTPADRKDLESLVKANWDSKVQKPLGQAAEHTTHNWHHAKEWIFDTWSDSQLKAFLDRHGVPVPQPRKRDVLLKTARENYESIAKKFGETAAYPGNWLYEHWSESDLKEWLDERGWPVPQPTTRDRLIASVRRNARLASLQARNIAASATKSAEAAQSSLSEALFNAWSDSDLKKFLDEHNVKVPQGSKRNELIALARKHRASLVSQASVASETASQSVTELIGAATSKAGNQYARATDDATLKAQDAFDAAVESWSDSRLKAYLDARGVPVPQASKRDELLAKVRLNKHKAATGWTAWTFDTWNTEQLKKYLSSLNAKAAHRADVTRDELLKQAQDAYAKASKSGGVNLASATSYMAQATDAAKDTTFDTWSHSELKAYLDSYGIPVYQGSGVNELRAAARRNSQYFRYGTTSPQGILYSKLHEWTQWVMDQLKIGASSGRAQGQEAAEKVKEKASAETERIRSEL